MNSALQLNRETQQELKPIIDALRPAALEGKGLAQAIKEYANRWQEHTGIQVTTTISGERSLPLDVEQALFRVLQESLANVARHARSRLGRTQPQHDSRRSDTIVADNGRGFEAERLSSQFPGAGRDEAAT